MIFTNQAELSIGEKTFLSNPVSGRLESAISVYKTTPLTAYEQGDRIYYSVYISNSSGTNYTDITARCPANPGGGYLPEQYRLLGD